MFRSFDRSELSLVELLVNRGADLATKDSTYHSTPLGWAKHFDRQEVVALLEK
ncbi:MAG: hypothetical protein ACXVPK_09265 [Tumebacillaceae bacterium]